MPKIVDKTGHGKMKEKTIYIYFETNYECRKQYAGAFHWCSKTTIIFSIL